jgi:hypothetical protein
MARIVLPVPARPSSATTFTSGSSSRSSANCCSLLRGRRPHGSGWRLREEHELVAVPAHERRLRPRTQHANSFSPSGVATDAVGVDGAGVEAVDHLVAVVELGPADVAAPGGACRGFVLADDAEVAALMRRAASFETIRRGPCAPGRGRRR